MKKILILGAGFLQSFIIKRAKYLGYETYVLDMDPNAVGFEYADNYSIINIVDKEKCLEYALENKIDGVLTGATDFGVLSVSYIAEKMGLNGLNLNSAEIIKDKYSVAKCFFDNQADDTEQIYKVNEKTDLDLLSEKIIYPVIVKPCDGSGSRGTNRVDKRKNLENACKIAINSSLRKEALVTSFIVGNEYGAESFVENGNIHILAVMKKWMTKPPYYAELGHAVPTDLNEETENKIRECVTKAIRALNVNFGSVNMDILVTEKGTVHIIDVGARMGGNLIGSHIIPLSSGIDYIGNMIKCAVGDKPDFIRKFTHSVATKLLALTPGKVRALPNFEYYENKYSVSVEHHLKEGDIITPYRTNLDGCGYVVSYKNEDNVSVARTVVKEIDRDIIRY